MTRSLLWAAVAVALAMGGLPAALAQDYVASRWGTVQVCPPCPTNQTPGTTPFVPEPKSAVPGQAPQTGQGGAAAAAPNANTPSSAAANANNALSQAGQGEQVASAAESYAPNMIGDWLVPTFVTVGHSGTSDCVSSPSGGFGRFKMADDTSPLPQDRVLLDNSYFSGAYGANGAGADTRFGVDGFEAGFEKTFLSGAASIELRAPLSNEDTLGTRFGDLGIAVKGLLINRSDLAICAGMSMNVPTGPNVVDTGLEAGAETVTIENQSVHLLPFVGALWMPSSRFFAQGYIQLDMDASGNEVLAGPTAGPLTSVGRLYDPTFLYVDVGAGYWLRRGDDSRLISGIACIGEIHVNESLASGGVISDGSIVVPPYNYSFVDLTAGVHLDVGQHCNVTFGYVAPLSGGPARDFNGEFRALCNYRF